MTNAENFLMYLLVICVSSLKKSLFRYFTHFYLIYYYWAIRILYRSPSRYKCFITFMICKYFLFCGFSLHFLGALETHFLWSPFYLVFSCCLSYGNISKNSGLIQNHKDYVCFHQSFIVLVLKFRSLIDLNYFCTLYEVQTSFFCMWIANFTNRICWKTIVSPLSCLDTLVENQLNKDVRVYCWILNSIPLIYIYVYLYSMTTLSS